MKRVCVISAAHINDSRAQRTIRTMADLVKIDYFYLNLYGQKSSDKKIFNDNVSLYPIEPRKDFKVRLLNHTYIHREHFYFLKKIEEVGNKYDIIYVHDLIMASPGWKLAKKHNAKILYDIHDLQIETINQLFPQKASFLKMMVFNLLKSYMRFTSRNYERRFIKSCDLVITTNENCVAYLNKHYSIKKCLAIYNYPETREVEYTDLLYEKLELPKDKKIILYHGAFNPGRYLEEITGSAQYFDEDTILVLIGRGMLEPRMRKIVAERKIEHKVKFLNFVKYEELFPLITPASLGIMLLRHINLSKKLALANKVTEYMASGIPVLASHSPENTRIVNEANCGFLMNYESEEQLANVINEIVKRDKAELRELALNGKAKFKEKFNWETQKPIFEKAFKELL